LKHPLSIDQLQAAQSEITGKGKEMPSAGGSFAVLETLQNLLKYPEVPDHLLVMKGKVAAGNSHTGPVVLSIYVKSVGRCCVTAH
jgi:hypothetical protein